MTNFALGLALLGGGGSLLRSSSLGGLSFLSEGTSFVQVGAMDLLVKKDACLLLFAFNANSSGKLNDSWVATPNCSSRTRNGLVILVLDTVYHVIEILVRSDLRNERAERLLWIGSVKVEKLAKKDKTHDGDGLFIQKGPLFIAILVEGSAHRFTDSDKGIILGLVEKFGTRRRRHETKTRICCEETDVRSKICVAFKHFRARDQ